MRIPVIAVRARIGIVECRAPVRDVNRCGREGVGADSVRGLADTVVATSRAAVTRGNENRNAFGGSLLVRGIVRCVSGRAIYRLTLAVADAHDRRRTAAGVDQVLNGDRKSVV